MYKCTFVYTQKISKRWSLQENLTLLLFHELIMKIDVACKSDVMKQTDSDSTTGST